MKCKLSEELSRLSNLIKSFHKLLEKISEQAKTPFNRIEKTDNKKATCEQMAFAHFVC